jgi:hypothetical protein
MNSSMPTMSHSRLQTSPTAGDVFEARAPQRSAQPPTTPPSMILQWFKITFYLLMQLEYIYIDTIVLEFFNRILDIPNRNKILSVILRICVYARCGYLTFQG